MKNFKQLMIWQKGMEIWKETYDVTRLLPESEKFGIVSQMNRAAASIPSNVAEGASRDSPKDFNRFLQIALGSSFELETFLSGINMLALVDENISKQLLGLIEEEQKMLMAFMKKLK
ncbi:four helix bundle protein [Ekhidna sp.]|uniref:four helix bundle protein n=1 Tax=Ekhidna sp. TaxID=2608089 RepID=UPI003298ACCC